MKHIYLLLFMLIPMTGMAQEGISVARKFVRHFFR